MAEQKIEGKGSTLKWVYWSLGIVSMAIFFWGQVYDNLQIRLAMKAIPVLCMAFFLLTFSRGRYVTFLVIGLFFSVAGDLILEFDRGSLFVPGLISFLIAHLFYIVAFVSKNRSFHFLRMLPFLAYGIGFFIFLSPKLGNLALPVGIYVVVICLMMWRAAACLDTKSPEKLFWWAALIGAMVFAASDSMIAYNRFASPFLGARYAIMVSYWLAQLLLTYSASRFFEQKS